MNEYAHISVSSCLREKGSIKHPRRFEFKIENWKIIDVEAFYVPRPAVKRDSEI